MAIDLDYVLNAGDGIASVAPTGTAAPTGMAAATTPWVDLGTISTDGLTESINETRTTFKRWGSIITFKTVVTDQAKTFDVTFLESNPSVLGLFYKVATPTPDATSHIISFDDDTTGKVDLRAFLFDVIEGTNHIRFYCPRAEITGRKNPVYKTDSLIEYGVTISAYPDDSGIAVARSYLLDAVTP